MTKMRNYAAHAILKEAGKPLHYRDITRLAIEKQLIYPAGKTSTATLNAIVSVDIKRKGTGSQFVRVGRGIFGLRGESSSSSPVASLELDPDAFIAGEAGEESDE